MRHHGDEGVWLKSPHRIKAKDLGRWFTPLFSSAAQMSCTDAKTKISGWAFAEAWTLSLDKLLFCFFFLFA